MGDSPRGVDTPSSAVDGDGGVDDDDAQPQQAVYILPPPVPDRLSAEETKVGMDVYRRCGGLVGWEMIMRELEKLGQAMPTDRLVRLLDAVGYTTIMGADGVAQACLSMDAWLAILTALKVSHAKVAAQPDRDIVEAFASLGGGPSAGEPLEDGVLPNTSGAIQVEQLKSVVENFQLAIDVEAAMHEIDGGAAAAAGDGDGGADDSNRIRDGRVDYEEFKMFLLNPTSGGDEFPTPDMRDLQEPAVTEDELFAPVAGSGQRARLRTYFKGVAGARAVGRGKKADAAAEERRRAQKRHTLHSEDLRRRFVRIQMNHIHNVQQCRKDAAEVRTEGARSRSSSRAPGHPQLGRQSSQGSAGGGSPATDAAARRTERVKKKRRRQGLEAAEKSPSVRTIGFGNHYHNPHKKYPRFRSFKALPGHTATAEMAMLDGDACGGADTPPPASRGMSQSHVSVAPRLSGAMSSGQLLHWGASTGTGAGGDSRASVVRRQRSVSGRRSQAGDPPRTPTTPETHQLRRGGSQVLSPESGYQATPLMSMSAQQRLHRLDSNPPRAAAARARGSSQAHTTPRSQVGRSASASPVGSRQASPAGPRAQAAGARGSVRGIQRGATSPPPPADRRGTHTGGCSGTGTGTPGTTTPPAAMSLPGTPGRGVAAGDTDADADPHHAAATRALSIEFVNSACGAAEGDGGCALRRPEALADEDDDNRSTPPRSPAPRRIANAEEELPPPCASPPRILCSREMMVAPGAAVACTAGHGGVSPAAAASARAARGRPAVGEGHESDVVSPQPSPASTPVAAAGSPEGNRTTEVDKKGQNIEGPAATGAAAGDDSGAMPLDDVYSFLSAAGGDDDKTERSGVDATTAAAVGAAAVLAVIAVALCQAVPGAGNGGGGGTQQEGHPTCKPTATPPAIEPLDGDELLQWLSRADADSSLGDATAGESVRGTGWYATPTLTCDGDARKRWVRPWSASSSRPATCGHVVCEVCGETERSALRGGHGGHTCGAGGGTKSVKKPRPKTADPLRRRGVGGGSSAAATTAALSSSSPPSQLLLPQHAHTHTQQTKTRPSTAPLRRQPSALNLVNPVRGPAGAKGSGGGGSRRSKKHPPIAMRRAVAGTGHATYSGTTYGAHDPSYVGPAQVKALRAFRNNKLMQRVWDAERDYNMRYYAAATAAPAAALAIVTALQRQRLEGLAAVRDLSTVLHSVMFKRLFDGEIPPHFYPTSDAFTRSAIAAGRI